jgi:muramoyltetrapeptide carboxypeptidase
VLKPRPLRSGDRIAVVSPASPFDRDEFDRGVRELARLGYVPVYEDSVFARLGYLSGPADVRAAAFMRAWSDPAVAAVIAVRGGYGSVQLLPFLDKSVIRKHPKLFIGYSDLTTLLSWLTCSCGVTALHGPMLEGRLAKGSSGYDEPSFAALLQDGRGLELSPAGMTVLREGEATGPLFGGTLTQLVASLGTPYAFDPPKGAVLFLEDVNERPYRLDRMLTQLRLSGVLERASAIVFGEMPGCDEPGGIPTALETLRSFVGTVTGPVLTGFPSGHARGPIWTLPLGVTVRVVTRPQPAVIVEEAPVE